MTDWLSSLSLKPHRQHGSRKKTHLKRAYKCCVKLFKLRQCTLCTQGISSFLPRTSSGPITHLCNVKCPRNVCFSFTLRAPSSAFTCNPRRHICLYWPAAETWEGSQLHNGTETGILGQKQGALSRARPDRGRFLRHTTIPTVPQRSWCWSLIRTFVCVGGCFLFSALFVSLLNDSSFTCTPCHSSPLGVDSSALTQSKATETVPGTALGLHWQIREGRIAAGFHRWEKLSLAHSGVLKTQKTWAKLDVQGDVSRTNALTLFSDSDTHFYVCLGEFCIRPRFLNTSGNNTLWKYGSIIFPLPGKSIRSSASSRWKAEQVRWFQMWHCWKELLKRVTTKAARREFFQQVADTVVKYFIFAYVGKQCCAQGWLVIAASCPSSCSELPEEVCFSMLEANKRKARLVFCAIINSYTDSSDSCFYKTRDRWYIK